MTSIQDHCNLVQYEIAASLHTAEEGWNRLKHVLNLTVNDVEHVEHVELYTLVESYGILDLCNSASPRIPTCKHKKPSKEPNGNDAKYGPHVAADPCWSMLIHWTSCRYFAQKMSLGHRYCRRQTIPQRFTVDTVGICRLCMAVPQNSWHTNLYKACCHPRCP